ncbi:hypothetical protein DBT_1221 [Dissulfuribacter thermophilus]|uniref:Flagellar Assembly Protein A N-terminal region domain-containing protein n=1 Tax=Dissulfuribacter thermophilus TaxID=1156395 RepID=A0A1B9F6K2_9BACT|nr:flagellar assembly protein A [Dissulfuribacter thermophilus]OCC15474.1 hypothetical protein DBT_1221 [Dissulfuribacter thermophilus]
MIENSSEELDLKKEAVEDITEWILNTIEEVNTESGYCLKVAMDLPPISKAEPKILVSAIEGILAHYNIQIPSDIRQELLETQQHEAVFLAPALGKDLRPRTVSINTNAEIRALIIRGEPPIDGLDGKIEVHFDYNEKPGKFLPDGTIDFRTINKFPQAYAGQILLTIYEPTNGTPGTDVEGRLIPPKIGHAFEVDVGEGIEVRRDYDDEEKRHLYEYLADRSGIIICDFENDIRDAYHLRQIEVRNRLIVRNIDFSTGNIGDLIEEVRCVADVIVEGDIRGNFAVIIDGNLEVKGAVEGERIDVSGELKAAYIRSSVKVGKKIEAWTALNARLKSDEFVLIRREVARCLIISPIVVMQPKGIPVILIGQCDVAARRLYIDRCEIRSHLNVEIGKDLFDELDQVFQKREMLKRSIESLRVELKDKAMIFLEKIKTIKNAFGNHKDREFEFLKDLGTRLLKGEIGFEEAILQLKQWGKIENNVNLPLVKALKSFIDTKENEARVTQDLEAIEIQKKELEQELSRMEVRVKGILKGCGCLNIRCNEQSFKWYADASSERTQITIQLNYIPGQGMVASEL